MSPESWYLLSFIAVTAVATLLTRCLPFLLLGRLSQQPFILHLGRYLPAGIMAILASSFLLQSSDWQLPLWGFDALIPALLVIIFHLWKRQALLSMLVGTLSYMLLQHSASLFAL
ncbi:AzlD domain-containing protein [Marinospirillum sp. MEB164]|uniref:AzlD domain-containing protein n=1 Tax=Marinospirillum alkalitolerans TaxID=3123374 RepID=A0ABW8Q0U3_9GAMM